MKRGPKHFRGESIQPRKKRATLQSKKTHSNQEIIDIIEHYDDAGKSAFESLWDDIGHLMTVDNLLRVEDGTTLLYDIVFSYFNSDPAANAFSITLFFDKYKDDPLFLLALTQTQTENQESPIHLVFMAAHYMDSTVFARDIEKIWQQFKTKQQFQLALMKPTESNHTPLYFLMKNMPTLFCKIFAVCKDFPNLSAILTLRINEEFKESLSILSWILHEDAFQSIRQEVWDLCKNSSGKLKLSWLEITAPHIHGSQLVDSLLHITASLCGINECQYFNDIYQQFGTNQKFLVHLDYGNKSISQYYYDVDMLLNFPALKAVNPTSERLKISDKLKMSPLLRIAAANNTKALMIMRQLLMHFRDNPVFVRALLMPCQIKKTNGASAIGKFLSSCYVEQNENYFIVLCESLIHIAKNHDIDVPLNHVLSFYQNRQYRKALQSKNKFKVKYHLLKAYSSACETNNIALIKKIAILYLNQNKNTRYENQIENAILCEKTQPVTFFRTLKLERQKIQLEKENKKLRGKLNELQSPMERPMSESAKNMYT